MRWITFFILLYAMAALQLADLGGIPHGDGAWPRIEYLPILAIFYALFAAEASAPICGLICGLAYDITNPSAFIGTHMVPIAIMALLVVRIRLSIFRDHLLSQLLITLLALLALAFLDVITRLLIGAPLDGGSVWIHFGHLAANAVYSAVVAPLLFWLFFRLTPILGFTSHGPRSRALDSRR